LLPKNLHLPHTLHKPTPWPPPPGGHRPRAWSSSRRTWTTSLGGRMRAARLPASHQVRPPSTRTEQARRWAKKESTRNRCTPSCFPRRGNRFAQARGRGCGRVGLGLLASWHPSSDGKPAAPLNIALRADQVVPPHKPEAGSIGARFELPRGWPSCLASRPGSPASSLRPRFTREPPMTGPCASSPPAGRPR